MKPADKIKYQRLVLVRANKNARGHWEDIDGERAITIDFGWMQSEDLYEGIRKLLAQWSDHRLVRRFAITLEEYGNGQTDKRGIWKPGSSRRT